MPAIHAWSLVLYSTGNRILRYPDAGGMARAPGSMTGVVLNCKKRCRGILRAVRGPTCNSKTFLDEGRIYKALFAYTASPRFPVVGVGRERIRFLQCLMVANPSYRVFPPGDLKKKWLLSTIDGNQQPATRQPIFIIRTRSRPRSTSPTPAITCTGKSYGLTLTFILPRSEHRFVG